MHNRRAVESILAFFEKKTWHCGGPIPRDLMLSARNYDLLLNVTLEEAITIGYRSINQCKCLAKTAYRKDTDSELFLQVMRECHRKCIPKEHIGGLFLLYLELCEQVQLVNF